MYKRQVQGHQSGHAHIAHRGVEVRAQDVYKRQVYQVDGNQGGDGYSLITEITVTAENRLTSGTPSSTKYTFELTYADPCADADITSFKLGNYTGSIDGRNITVTVPYGTDVKGMVANFTTSVCATVELNAYGSGSILVSGETSVNYMSLIHI